jgi:magnesium transporter
VKPGSSPGVDPRKPAARPPAGARATVTCIDYCADRAQVRKIEDLDAFLADHRPEWTAVRWIDVDGIGDEAVVKALATKYGLHPLAVEDLMQAGQRPKVETYPAVGEHHARVFVLTRMLELKERRVHAEQVSIFLGRRTVLSFQESPGDVWDPIRARLQAEGSRTRAQDASYLVYALLDAMVDHCFPILEHYGDRLADLEDEIVERPGMHVVKQVHEMKRDLLALRSAVWPMREVIHGLQREPHECITEVTRTYLRDVYDHAVQVIDILENYREVSSSLMETWMTATSNRLNEIIGVLTVISTIFVPLTFLAGVWGMNFHHMPELHETWAYPWGFWILSVVVAAGLLWLFRRKRWI